MLVNQPCQEGDDSTRRHTDRNVIPESTMVRPANDVGCPEHLGVLKCVAHEIERRDGTHQRFYNQ